MVAVISWGPATRRSCAWVGLYRARRKRGVAPPRVRGRRDARAPAPPPPQVHVYRAWHERAGGGRLVGTVAPCARGRCGTGAHRERRVAERGRRGAHVRAAALLCRSAFGRRAQLPSRICVGACGGWVAGGRATSLGGRRCRFRMTATCSYLGAWAAGRRLGAGGDSRARSIVPVVDAAAAGYHVATDVLFGAWLFVSATGGVPCVRAHANMHLRMCAPRELRSSGVRAGTRPRSWACRQSPSRGPPLASSRSYTRRLRPRPRPRPRPHQSSRVGRHSTAPRWGWLWRSRARSPRLSRS